MKVAAGAPLGPVPVRFHRPGIVRDVHVDRLSGSDAMDLECDVSGTSMQVAGVLLLENRAPMDLNRVRASLSARIVGVPRLRQRLLVGRFGGGRPVWVDDNAFDINRHVATQRCAPPGDQQAMLDAVAEIVTRRLPPDRPLWSATLIEGLAAGRSALVLVFHHTLADGIGGLAVFGRLMDGSPARADPEFPRRSPRHRELVMDALVAKALALRRTPGGLTRIPGAMVELAGAGATPAPRCSLNRPIGSGRALSLVTVSLADVRSAAHRQGGTVNDVILTAVAGALRTVLATRGEDVDRFVISVPVSARQTDQAMAAGNQVGVRPMVIPAVGDACSRLAATARVTRGRRTADPGSSAALISPVFRVLARLGVFGWFINRQRRVNTFVSNLRGPVAELTFLGNQVTGLLSVPMIAGNVSVAFGALSYRGILQVCVIVDPVLCPDLADLTIELSREFTLLTDPESVANGSDRAAGSPGRELV